MYNIDRLAGNDVLKWEQVEQMNVVAFLNALSFIKQKDEWEAEKQREAIRNQKL